MRFDLPVFLTVVCAVAFVGCTRVSTTPQDAAWAALSGRPVLESGGVRALARFFRRLTTLGAAPAGTRLRVAHFGDSHTAADFWTGQIRDALQERFGDGGRGFLMFGRPWEGYWPQGAETGATGGWTGSNALDISVRGQEGGVYGLGGGALCADEAGPEAWIILSAQDGPRVGSVYYTKRPRGGILELTIGDQDPVLLSTAAETPSLGVHAWRLDKSAPKALRVRSGGSGPVCVLGADMERPQTGIVYDAMGLNGARMTHLREWDGWIGPMLRARDYHLVVVSYGTNEAVDEWLDLASYRSAADAVLGRVRSLTPGADCLLVGPPPSGDPMAPAPRFQERLLPLIALQKELARGHACAYFDTLAWTGGPPIFVDWLGDPEAVLTQLDERFGLSTARRLRARPVPAALFLADRIHLTVEGYKVLGDLVADALLRTWSAHLRGAAAEALRGLLGR